MGVVRGRRRVRRDRRKEQWLGYVLRMAEGEEECDKRKYECWGKVFSYVISEMEGCSMTDRRRKR